MQPQKALVIIGPTASGKSSLAIQLALEKNGEIISVDSRQVYQKMNIGTGKVTEDEQNMVPHHLLDVVQPGEEYNVTDFCRDATKKESEIRSRGKLPIFCGGSLFWVESYLNNASFPTVPPNPGFRTLLETRTVESLFQDLQQKDPVRANNIDPHNKVRLIRALEIIEMLGAVPPQPADEQVWRENYELIILEPEKEALRNNIQKRLEQRLAEGMVQEVEKLLQEGASHEWLQKIGLEYRFISLYLQNKLTYEEMKQKLFFAIWHYAKRQITFLKRFQ